MWNAERKDRLERRLCGLACTGELDIADAQLVFTGDWVAGYRVYYEGRKRP